MSVKGGGGGRSLAGPVSLPRLMNKRRNQSLAAPASHFRRCQGWCTSLDIAPSCSVEADVKEAGCWERRDGMSTLGLNGGWTNKRPNQGVLAGEI